MSRNRGDTPQAGTPRWVKVFALVALFLVVAAFVVLIVGRAGHGPGRHTGANAPSGRIGDYGPPPPGGRSTS